jgi:DNA-binding transcriptional LysR family regulator
MAAHSTARLDYLRLRDLLIIERVHELGSLRKVAESLHLTQPAVTQALQTLEDAFGARLVERSSGGALLTEAGLAVLQRVRPLRHEALAALAAASHPRLPAITLGIVQVSAIEIAPAAISAFLRAQPDVRLHIVEGNSPDLWQRLGAGELDAIVCRIPPADAFEPLSQVIAYDMLGTERMAVVAARAHPLFDGPFDKARLADQRWVLPPADSRARHTLNEWFLQAGIPIPVATITSESIQMNIRLVAASTLLTVVPESTYAELREPLKLAAAPVHTTWDGFSYAFACRRSSLAHPVVETLRGHFVRLGWPLRERTQAG